MKALDRKVWRDLRLLCSQAITIALVVASGIGGFVGCLSAVDSLALARDGFYERGQFADVFASVKRAPDALARRLAEVDGVLVEQTTVEAGARITMPRSPDPVIGQRVNTLIDVTGPPADWQAMGDGFRVVVRVITHSEDEALMVPVGALFPDGDGFAVYVLDGRRARLHRVDVGGRNGSQAWVRSGLQPGQAVIAYPPAAVADGRRVKARQP